MSNPVCEIFIVDELVNLLHKSSPAMVYTFMDPHLYQSYCFKPKSMKQDNYAYILEVEL